ncbi:D-alanyl-lipoteichoic acid biosynthesis protein DltD [Metabacillus fastidiosus]|uniref:D-alanyl-lipoteichoic acid biosynthesis protein DltD n=1 Tax=Metabacillus fastidiosus TaxID=1458 RepID=UPI002E225102|nr:hypothetical protein [Metabacillus fastidiosus]
MVVIKERISLAIDELSNNLELTISKINKNEIDYKLIKIIDTGIIENFVQINKLISDNNQEIDLLTNRLADSIVELVYIVKSGGDSEKIKNLLNMEILPGFIEWRQLIEQTLRYKIVVFGINNYCGIIPGLIDQDKSKIIAYIDDTSEKVGSEINGCPIISINQLDNLQYDYLLLLNSNYEIINNKIKQGKINIENIFNFNRHFLIDTDYNFYSKYYNFIDDNKDFEGIITGLSYAEIGIDPKILQKNFFNFAVSSQDLFFDYQIMKFLLEFSELRENIKYSVISLAYYSFGYDLSKSKNVRTLRTEIYYPILGTVHNYHPGKEFIKEYDNYSSICKKLLTEDFSRQLYNIMEPIGRNTIDRTLRKEFSSQKMTHEEVLKEKESVEKDFKKRYPDTVKENTQILKSYLNLLKENSIKPIIVVCPVSKFYQENASDDIKVEFDKIINDMKQEYDFQIIDLFYSDKFVDSDFYDSSHLNYNGAEKFTNILNKLITW